MKTVFRYSLMFIMMLAFSSFTWAGLFDALSSGLKKTVSVVNDTANQTLTSVSNVVPITIPIETNVTQIVTAPQAVEGIIKSDEAPAVLDSKLSVLNPQQPLNNVKKHKHPKNPYVQNPYVQSNKNHNGHKEQHSKQNMHDGIVKKSADFLSGEFKIRASKLIERDGGENGQRYNGSIFRLWMSYINVRPESPCERVYGGRFPEMPDLIQSGGALLPKSADSYESWTHAIREALRKEEVYFDNRDEEVKMAKAKKEEDERRARIKAEQKIAYNRDRDEIRKALAALEGDNTSELIQSGERGQLLVALMDSHEEIIQPMKIHICEIKKQYFELPSEPDDKVIQRVVDLKHDIKQLQDKLMAAVKDVKERNESNRRQLIMLRTQTPGMNDTKIDQLPIMPGICLGDSLFSVLCSLKDTARKVTRPSKHEKIEVHGQTHVVFPKSPAIAELENFRLDFGAFSETQEVFLVRARFGYTQNTELKFAVDGFNRMLPDSASCKEEQQIVGYDENELKKRNPWAEWQLKYYRKRVKTLKNDNLRAKNLALVEFVLNKYHAVPFLRKKVTLECAGYGIEVVTHSGNDFVDVVTLEDRIASDKIILR